MHGPVTPPTELTQWWAVLLILHGASSGDHQVGNNYYRDIRSERRFRNKKPAAPWLTTPTTTHRSSPPCCAAIAPPQSQAWGHAPTTRSMSVRCCRSMCHVRLRQHQPSHRLSPARPPLCCPRHSAPCCARACLGFNEPIRRQSRGRPATEKGIQVGERWPPGAIAQIDDWRHQQLDLPGRPEAIRRLVEIGLKAKR